VMTPKIGIAAASDQRPSRPKRPGLPSGRNPSYQH
jgi:hypothetical protein